MLYRASIGPGQEVSRAPASNVEIVDYSSLFCHDWAYLETPGRQGNQGFAHLHIKACFPRYNKQCRFGGKHTGRSASSSCVTPGSESIQGKTMQQIECATAAFADHE
jgi:hypothetical protein